MSKKRSKKVVHKITAQQLLLSDLHSVLKQKLMPEENAKVQSLILGFMRYNGWTDSQVWLVKSLIEKAGLVKPELKSEGVRK